MSSTLGSAAYCPESWREQRGPVRLFVHTLEGIAPAVDVALGDDAVGEHQVAGCPEWWPHAGRHRHDRVGTLVHDLFQASGAGQLAEAQPDRRVVAAPAMELDVPLRRVIERWVKVDDA